MTAATPRTFSCKDGTKLVVAVNFLTVKRVRELTGANVLDILGTGEQLAGYVTDDIKLLEVLCAVVRPQIQAIGWSDDDFFSQCDGEVVANATNLLLDEVADFFHEPRKGLVKKALAKIRAAMEAMERREVKAATEALDALDCETLLATPGPSDCVSPASSASSRGRSRSATSTKWRGAGSTKLGSTPAT